MVYYLLPIDRLLKSERSFQCVTAAMDKKKMKKWPWQKFGDFCVMQETGREDWLVLLEHWFYSRSSCNNMYLRKQPISTLGTIPNVYSTGEKSSSDIFRKDFFFTVFVRNVIRKLPK